MKDTKIKLAELATRINAHLRRIEADPVLNPNSKPDGMGTSPYWHSGCVASSNRVFVTYISYQGQSSLTREQALRYLAWLDAGNVGKHWAMERHASA